MIRDLSGLRRLLIVGAACLSAGLMMASCQPTGAIKDNQALTIPPLEPAFRTLENGLRVYSLPDSSTGSVTVQVWYDVGSKDDPPGRSGFAHLFEHLMFKSTQNMPPEFFDRLTEDAGGYNNASTWNDFTNYYETVPANHLERVLWGEAERMGSLVVDEANFRSERDVVKEELRQSVLSQPYGKLFALYIAQSSFSVHPYGRPGIGSIADLDAATLADVRAFHAAYYRPDNAVLVVSGNFDQARLDEWVDRYFAGIKTPSRPIPRVTAVEPARTAARDLTVYEPNVPLPAIAVSWPSPPASSETIADWMVLDAILTRGQSSRLYQSMVYEQQTAAEVFSNFEVTQHPGVYSLGAILSEGKTAEEGLTLLNSEIARIRDGGVTEAEIAEAKNELLSEAIQARETAEGRAFDLARSVVLFKDAKASDALLASLQEATVASVGRLAADLLKAERATTIRYLPEELQNGAKEDIFGDPPGIEATALDIPAADIPSYQLAAEGLRAQPPAPGDAIAASVPSAQTRTLENGLKVIVAPKRGLPLISASLKLEAGAGLDPVGKAGLAAMTADLATRGAGERSATDIARQTESLGAAISAGAGADATDVSIVTRSDHASEVFAILADVVRSPTFAAEELDRARQETLDGLMVALRQPSSIGRFAMSRLIFADGPYGSTPSPDSIQSLTREDILGFHASTWRPDGAVLVIAGDLEPEEGFKLAETAFGDWRASEAAGTRNAPSPPGAPAPGPRTVVIDVPDIGQAAVLMGGVGPSRTDADYFATLVANDVLGGGYSARLNAEIRIKRGLSYGARSQLSSRRSPGPIIASAQTRNDAVPQVVELMALELARLGSATISEAELSARKAVLVGSFGRDVETTGGLAGQIASLAQFGLPPETLSSFPAEVLKVSAADAGAAGRAHYDPARVNLVVVGDAKTFWKEISRLRPDAQRIAIDALDLDTPSLSEK
jgi:zinc protease